jgi:hypothetical protein
MLKRYIEVINKQSENVFGAKPKGVLSAYSVFALACAVLPIAALLAMLIMKLF